MKEFINKLHEERNRAWEEAKALLDAAESEGRDLSAEDQTKWERLNETIDHNDERINEMLSVEERERKADEQRARLEAIQAEAPAVRETDRGPSNMDMLDKLRRGEVRAVDLTPERRDLTKGTATDGAELVATDFYGQLVEHMIESSAIRQTNVTVLRTDSGRDLQVPKTTSYSSASIVSEGGSIGESDPQFGQVTLGAFKYAFLLQVSSELQDDQSIGDFAGFLARQGGRALGNGSGTHFVTGDGSAKPNGVVTAATVGFTQTTTGVSGVPQGDDLIELFHSVIPEYRSNSYWLMSDVTAKGVRKLKDDNSQYLWQPGLQAGQPDSILGKPVVIDTNVADAATDATSVVFGDFSGYFIRDVVGVRIERSDDFAFANDLATYRFILRTDGDLVDTNAVKTFVGAAT